MHQHCWQREKERERERERVGRWLGDYIPVLVFTCLLISAVSLVNEVNDLTPRTHQILNVARLHWLGLHTSIAAAFINNYNIQNIFSSLLQIVFGRVLIGPGRMGVGVLLGYHSLKNFEDLGAHDWLKEYSLQFIFSVHFNTRIPVFQFLYRLERSGDWFEDGSAW